MIIIFVAAGALLAASLYVGRLADAMPRTVRVLGLLFGVAGAALLLFVILPNRWTWT